MNAAASGLSVFVALLLLFGPNRTPNDVWVSVLIAALFGFAVWSALDLLEAVGRRRR